MSPQAFSYVLLELEPILNTILTICKGSGEPLMEGNCFYQHMTNGKRIPELFSKQMNLYNAAKYSKHIMEIGFNAGHSSLLFLMANPSSKLTIFDICEHAYTKPCVEYLMSLFPERITFIEGDSTKTVPKYFEKHPDVSFDLIHIDGAHDVSIADKDFKNSYPMASNTIIWDDTQDEGLRKLLDSYISQCLVSEVQMEETFIYKHAIVKVMKPNKFS
jgi:hypothetical protein